MTKIISVANQKGGVGKTTTSINISASLAVAERKTLLIDIDPQANSTSGLGIETSEIQYSIYDVLSSQTPINDVIIPTKVPNLDIIPSHINLVGSEIELVSLPYREKILKKAFEGLTKDYRYIIIDCPPSLGLLTLNALTASDSVLIPVQAEYYALEGLGQLLNTINIVRKHLNPKLELEGVLITMYDSRLRLSKQVAEEVRKYFRSKVFNTVIFRNVRLSEAPSFGKPVILHDAVSMGTYNYIDVANEIIQRNETQKANVEQTEKPDENLSVQDKQEIKTENITETTEKSINSDEINNV
ncbi:MAG TPA: AAA family ATPase [Bacteroidota bacterium]|jgi:chromosome partitioning protein|nr:AAA family ATPase [Bacteroidota bacterium]